MNEEDLERYETEVELQIYKEYRDVLPLFKYVVETEQDAFALIADPYMVSFLFQ